MSKAIGVVVMAAIPPTMGHAALIEFASEFMFRYGGQLTVIVQTSDGEPFQMERVLALNSRYMDYGNVHVEHIHCNRNAPDSPDDTSFWDMWRTIINQKSCWHNKYYVGGERFIFSSESYGKRFAEEMGAVHIPFDPDRTMVEVKATNLRMESLWGYNPFWENTIPEFRWVYNKTVTFFGAESTGKSTASYEIDQYRLPEYARNYLEHVGTEITEEKMEHIWIGQYAMQKAAEERRNSELIVQDTDLLTCIGYRRLYGFPVTDALVAAFKETKSDLYLLMSTKQMKFKPDPLRYGGNKRESGDQFWIDLLKEYDCKYEVLKGDLYERTYNSRTHIHDLVASNPIFGYQRKDN